MTNEEVEDVVDVPEIALSVDEEGNDTTDWKALAEANRELALKNLGIAKRNKTRAEKALKPKDEPQATPVVQKEPKSGDIGYSEKAFLKSYGISGSDELALVKEFVANTGKTLDDLVDNKYFNNSLTELREARATTNATPAGTKRAAQSPKDDIEYWLAKPFDEVPKDMRIKVIDARMAKEKDSSMFSDNPVISR